MSRTARWVVGGFIGIIAIGVFGRMVGAEEPSTSPAAPPPAAATPSTSSTTSSTVQSARSSVTSSPAAATTAEELGGFVVVAVVDGDTVRVRPAGSGSQQKVRLIGIDAPETGACAASAATAALEQLVLNRTVALTMGGDGEDLDPYGRALRYVDTSDGDAGLAMITGGHAIARYDSRDGYGRHDREDAYLAADAASPAYTCPPAAPTPTTTQPDPGPRAAPAPDAESESSLPAPRPSTTSRPAVAYYPNCAAARAAGAAPLYVGEPGYSRKLDRDGDGVACE